jgi:riboflavin synthase alpha subunit
VHGVSLTVNGVAGSRFHVNLIPHHARRFTTLKKKNKGGGRSRTGAKGRILEVDLVARYCRRRLHERRGLNRKTPGAYDGAPAQLA